MRSLVVIGFGFALVWAAMAQDKKDAKFDPAKLDGKWEFVSGTKAGAKLDADALKKFSVEIAKDKLTLSSPDGAFKMKFTLDAKKDPAAIDLEITEGPIGTGAMSKGIVAMDGDNLKLCYDPNGGDRPTKFDGDKGNNYFVMKRAKKDDKK